MAAMEGRLSAFRAAFYGQRTSAGKGGEKAFQEREWHLQSGEAKQADPELEAGKLLRLRVCLGGEGQGRRQDPQKVAGPPDGEEQVRAYSPLPSPGIQG